MDYAVCAELWENWLANGRWVMGWEMDGKRTYDVDGNDLAVEVQP